MSYYFRVLFLFFFLLFFPAKNIPLTEFYKQLHVIIWQDKDIVLFG